MQTKAEPPMAALLFCFKKFQQPTRGQLALGAVENLGLPRHLDRFQLALV